MITNDQELQGIRERITYFGRLLRQLRATASSEEFRTMAGGYQDELKRVRIVRGGRHALAIRRVAVAVCYCSTARGKLPRLSLRPEPI